MTSQQLTPSTESDSNARKRVCKACDRCRLKKSKCDGSTPCSRCRSDNAICVFGERKKSHDKVYPKGYVEMLEQQQVQLVNGLQELYKRNVMGQGWTGPLLQDFGSGRPLTHDILDHLGVLKQDTRSDSETFEDDLDTMQQRLIAGGADLMQRRSSSDSDNEQYHGQISFFDPAASNPTFPEPFASAHLPTPPVQSPRALSLHAVQRATSLHPQALHAPGCPNSQPNLNPTVLQQQTWTQSPQSYSENLDFLQFERTSNFGTAKFSNPQRPMAVGDPCPNAAMPDWAEDDFNSFLNTSMV